MPSRTACGHAAGDLGRRPRCRFRAGDIMTRGVHDDANSSMCGGDRRRPRHRGRRRERIRRRSRVARSNSAIGRPATARRPAGSPPSTSRSVSTSRQVPGAERERGVAPAVGAHTEPRHDGDEIVAAREREHAVGVRARRGERAVRRREQLGRRGGAARARGGSSTASRVRDRRRPRAARASRELAQPARARCEIDRAAVVGIDERCRRAARCPGRGRARRAR